MATAAQCTRPLKKDFSHLKVFLKGLKVQHWVQVVMTVAQMCWGELVAFKVIFGEEAWLGLKTTKWRGRSFCKNKHNKLNLILASLVSSPEDTHFWVDSCGVYHNHNLLPLHHKRHDLLWDYKVHSATTFALWGCKCYFIWLAGRTPKNPGNQARPYFIIVRSCFKFYLQRSAVKSEAAGRKVVGKL